jgi:hypothetical protein
MRKSATLCLVFLALFSVFIHAEDIQLEVHQSVLEKFLTALAPINGSGDYRSPAGPIPYHWEIKNPKINLTEGEASFTADTTVGMAGAKYKTIAKGRGAASYDPTANMLVFQIKYAAFSLSLSLLALLRNDSSARFSSSLCSSATPQ